MLILSIVCPVGQDNVNCPSQLCNYAGCPDKPQENLKCLVESCGKCGVKFINKTTGETVDCGPGMDIFFLFMNFLTQHCWAACGNLWELGILLGKTQTSLICLSANVRVAIEMQYHLNNINFDNRNSQTTPLSRVADWFVSKCFTHSNDEICISSVIAALVERRYYCVH